MTALFLSYEPLFPAPRIEQVLSRGKRLLLWAVEKPPQLVEVGWPRCRLNSTGLGIGTPRSRGHFICVP